MIVFNFVFLRELKYSSVYIMNQDNYGFAFNNITVNNDVVNKQSKNSYGNVKINNEIEFYLYVIKNKVKFPMPRLINYADGFLSIEYIRDSSTLTKKVNSTNVYEYINKIETFLKCMHLIQRPVSFDTIRVDLDIELSKKIMDRFNEYDWTSNAQFNSITSVNGIKIKNILYYSDLIKSTLFSHLKPRDYYNLIHGDVHLGNILLDKNDDIYFIDPRGYFGESKLFGLYEYDYAKLLFGLSGYSIFDEMNITELKIIDNNLEIEFIKQHEYIFENKLFDKVATLLCLSIWLGNNSCFSNINKKITSLMIAYYYCEKYTDCR